MREVRANGAAAALLRAGARVAPTADDVERLRTAVSRVRDWDAALALAGRHHVVPLVARQLAASAADVVPARALDAFQATSRAIAAGALVLAGELARIVAALEAQGVRALPYKGPALALAAYGDTGMRECEDLDVVVPPADYARARKTLLALGYRSLRALSPAQEAVVYGGQGHAPFERADREALLVVELHWRFAARRFPWNPRLDDLLARAASLPIGGVRVALPAREDHLLLLLLHGTRHRWERLEWAASVSALLAGGPVDGGVLLARAARVGGTRAALVGLQVARRVLGAPVSEELLARADHDAAVEPLAREAIARMFAPPDEAAGRDGEREFHRRCLERPLDHARFLALSVLLPTPREWELVRLPGVLAPLYVPIRIGRLVLRGAQSEGE